MGAASFSGPAASCYLVEWYRRESVEESVEANAAKLDVGVASICAEGLDVRLLAILAVPTDEVVFGVFAGTADDIARACNIAGLPADRLSRADASLASAERARAELE